MTAPVFTADDLCRLITAFPPESTLPLLHTTQNDGFVNAAFLREQLNSIVNTESGRLSIVALAERFGIRSQDVLDTIGKLDEGQVFSSNKSAILTRQERDSLLAKLQDRAVIDAVHIPDFARENDIEHGGVELLIYGALSSHSLAIASCDGHNLTRDSNYVYNTQLVEDMERPLQEQMRLAQQNAVPLVLDINRNGVEPSRPFLTFVLGRVLLKHGDLYGHCEHNESGSVWVPLSCTLRKRDTELDQLRSGNIPVINLEALIDDSGNKFSGFDDAGQLFSNLDGAQNFLRDRLGNKVDYFANFAVSKAWLDSLVSKDVEHLQVNGHTAISVSTGYGASLTNYETSVLTGFLREQNSLSVLPESTRPHYCTLVQTGVKAAFQEAEGTEVFGDYLVTSILRQNLCTSVVEQTKQQAKTQWDAFTQNRGAECCLDTTKVLDNATRELPMDPQLTRLIWENMLRTEAERAFNQEVDKLEAQADEEFAAFWQERMLTRFQLYRSGVEALDNDKLQSHLIELLQQYIVNEIIPDTFAKAESKGLLRSRKTRRNTDKLSGALQAFKNDSKEPAAAMQSLTTSLEKFMRKQSIQWLADDTLSAKKDVQLQEMVKGMRKDADGPRLFLTLVVVLLSKNREGVVYATGKFAPRLLKLLRGSLTPERYDRLERLKDAVKGGSLTEADKEDMRDMTAAS